MFSPGGVNWNDSCLPETPVDRLERQLAQARESCPGNGFGGPPQ